jgi:5'-deoxynucleotidase YfbR-like HD superfamily hydrolase
MGKSAAQDYEKIMHDVLDLYEGLLIPYMQVQRDLPFPGDPERNETDGEHAFILAMVAITIAQKMNLPLDHGKIARYALIHDLVEAHAGDVSAIKYTDEDQAIKVDREREAFLVIKDRYAKNAPWIPELIEKYDDKADEEARFVYAVDKQMGSLSWLSGGITEWSNIYPEPDGSLYHNVVKRLRKKASVYPDLLPLFDLLHEKLDQEWPKHLRSKK